MRPKARHLPQTNLTTTMVLPAGVVVKPVSSFIPRPPPGVFRPVCLRPGSAGGSLPRRLMVPRFWCVAFMLRMLSSHCLNGLLFGISYVLLPNMSYNFIPVPSFCWQVMRMCTSLRSWWLPERGAASHDCVWSSELLCKFLA